MSDNQPNIGAAPRLWRGADDLHIPREAMTRGQKVRFFKLDGQDVISISNARDDLNRGTFPVTESHKELWPEQWQAYLDDAEQGIKGTPLADWPLCPKDVVEELAASDIETVEELAAVSDSNLGSVLQHNSRHYRDLAKRHLDSCDAELMRGRIVELETQIRLLTPKVKEIPNVE